MYCYSKREECKVECLCDKCDNRKSCPNVCSTRPWLSFAGSSIIKRGMDRENYGGPYHKCAYFRDWINRIFLRRI